MKSYKLPDDAMLLMTWLEAGYLRGALEKNGEFKNLPKTLQLKLNILFTQAYLSNPDLKEKAKQDISNYQAELKQLEKEVNNT